MATDALNLTWRELARTAIPVEPLFPAGLTSQQFSAAFAPTAQAIGAGVVPTAYGYNAQTGRYEVAATGASNLVIAAFPDTAASWVAPSMAVEGIFGPVPADYSTATQCQQGVMVMAKSAAGGLSVGDGVQVACNHRDGSIQFALYKGGSAVYVPSAGSTPGNAGGGCAGVNLVLSGTKAATYYLPIGGTSWLLAQEFDISSYFDPTAAATLAALCPAPFAVYQSAVSSNRISFRSFRAGYAGLVGAREPNPVTYEDGTPYIKGDKLYFTLDSYYPGTGNPNYSPNGWFLYSLDLPALRSGQAALRAESVLFNRRGGVVERDNDGDLMFDRNLGGGTWRVTMNGWGTTPGTDTRAWDGTTTTDITVPGAYVIDTTQATLPGPGAGDLLYDVDTVKIAGTWYRAYSINHGGNLAPYLASSTDYTTWTAVGNAAGAGSAVEGTRIWRVNGTNYVAAGNKNAPAAGRPYNLYSLADMSLLGQLQTGVVGAGLYCSHPALAALPLGRIATGRTVGTQYLLMEFTDTGLSGNQDTCGQLVFSIANETNAADEYPWIDAQSAVADLTSADLSTIASAVWTAPTRTTTA